jgi:hypothetical protein
MAALPLVARDEPAQPSSVPPPLAIHVLALAEVHVNIVELPDEIVVGDAFRVTVRAGQVTITGPVVGSALCEPTVQVSPYVNVAAMDSVTDCVPLAAMGPVHPSLPAPLIDAEPPFATQIAPDDAAHESVIGTPVMTVEALAEIVT